MIFFPSLQIRGPFPKFNTILLKTHGNIKEDNKNRPFGVKMENTSFQPSRKIGSDPRKTTRIIPKCDLVKLIVNFNVETESGSDKFFKNENFTPHPW